MGKHCFFAKAAPAAGGNQGDEHFIPLVKIQYACSKLIDNSHAFMTENTPVWNRRHIAIEYVQIGSANGGRGDAHDSVSRFLDIRLWSVLQRQFIWPVEYERLH